MNMLRLPVLFYTVLFLAGHLLHADFAVSADPETPAAVPDCFAPCRTQYTDCFEKVKDSPNDVERELCENERKECVTKCDAETKERVKELQEQENKKQQEREMLLKQEKEMWDQQGLPKQEQRRLIRERKELEREQEDAGPQEQ